MGPSTNLVLAAKVVGVEVPDTSPAFLVVLAVHVAAGLVAVLAGLLAALARKRVGRHPVAGRVYLGGLATVAATATVLAVLRWPHDVHLLALGMIALGCGLGGFMARRRRRPGWVRRHILGMGGSYVVLLTAFYVDNGPQLPVWQLLPAWVFWVLPAVVGAPLIAAAVRRYGPGRGLNPAGNGPTGSAGTRRPPAGTAPR